MGKWINQVKENFPHTYDFHTDSVDVLGNESSVSTLSVQNSKIEGKNHYRMSTLSVPTLSDSTKNEIVCCNDCSHFIPDQIGFGGIGTCSIGEKAWLKTLKPIPPWPYAKRICTFFLIKQNY